MIPLARNGVRRNASSVVPVSRQSLPRPARLYSSPSKSAQAQAVAAAASTHNPSLPYPSFMPQAGPSRTVPESQDAYHDMSSFLMRRVPYTYIPTPLPKDRSSSINDFYFTDSSTQDQVSIIGACLHNLQDVSRAKQVFDQLRHGEKARSLIDIAVYNSFLDAYLEMARSKESQRMMYWVEDACALYEEMEEGRTTVTPNAHTYTAMLRLYNLFGPESNSGIPVTTGLPTPQDLLKAIHAREIPVSLVVSDMSVQSTDEASGIMKLLSGAAVSMNLSKVVNELGLTETLGASLPDLLDGVPEANPVLKAIKIPKVAVSRAEDGSITKIEAAEQAGVESGYEVPFHLDNLRKHLAQVCLARRMLPDDIAARQKLLEESVYDIAAARLKHEADLFASIGMGNSRLKDEKLRGWVWEWHQKLSTRIKDELERFLDLDPNSKEGRAVSNVLPFLTLLRPDKMSLLTILDILHVQTNGGLREGMKTARTLISIGRAVETEYKAEIFKKNNIAVPVSNTRAGEGFFNSLGYKNLQARRIAARRYMEDAEEWTTEWSQMTRVKVGSFLVDNLMATAFVTKTANDRFTGKQVSEEQPAFFHSYEYIRGHKLGVIKLNSLVVDHIARDSVRDTMHPRHLPMLVKPKQWLNHNDGGYLYNRSPVMRFKESVEQAAYLKRAAELGHVELIFAGLDVLGGTPWRVNREIFDVVLQVWNQGIRMPKIPPAIYDMPEPEKPANLDTDPKAKVVYLQRQRSYMADKANNHSERCNVNYKVEIARTFLGDTIYMPHNLDFRGRAYPVPPHLNHIGDDLSRGLLKFAEGKPLGERGLRWLKIHLANLYGFDKASFDERAQFAEDHREDIFDSAERPLEGNQWWVKADDPWQCLATCIELRNALQSPNPLEYVCALPVHQDGTCNGLQHYAALGGDSKGAQQVNLDVTDRPADVYTFVAEMVKESLKRDVDSGHEIAKKLDGKITRKVVKQTVMTTVYGVTFIGARDQIEKQLRDRGDLAPEETWEAAAYLAKSVLRCIGDLFSGAKSIQVWLNTCARLISKSIPKERISEAFTRDGTKGYRVGKEQMTSVIWTTPMGLPIVQPYRHAKRKQVQTSLQTVFISDPNTPASVNSLKQASAFPPNFIHSLDATHMLLTALECRTRGITFASVHDSYWTHACSVDEMSSVIRDTFIALHSRDVLSNLLEEFRERYKGFVVPLTVVRGIKHPEVTKTAERLYNELHAKSDVKIQQSFAEASRAEQTDVDDEDAFIDHEDEDAEAVTKKRRKGVAAAITEDSSPDSGARHTYFNVADLFPSVPAKGEFDVNKIKNSLYFFS